jgi:hypothetical protein
MSKRCKACRLRQCKSAGMEYRLRANFNLNKNGMEMDFQLPSPHLEDLIKAYEQFLRHQQIHFGNLYGQKEPKLIVSE